MIKAQSARVYWTSTEQDQLATAVAEQLAAFEIRTVPLMSDKRNGRIFLRAIQETQQKLLKPHRQRTLRTRQDLGAKFCGRLAEMLKDQAGPSNKDQVARAEGGEGANDQGSIPNDQGGEAVVETDEGNTRNNVRWTLPEAMKLADHIAGQMLKQGFPDVPPKGDRLGRTMVMDMHRLAQAKVLIRDRRRLDISACNITEEFWDGVRLSLARQAADQGPSDKEQATNGERILPPEIRPWQEVISAVPDGEVGAFLAARMGARTEQLETFVDLLVESITDLREKNEKLAGRLDRLENPGATMAEKTEGDETAQPRPRVAILGCRRYEFLHIKIGCEKLGLKLNLRHYDQDAVASTVHADYAIVMKFCLHSWHDQVRRAIPRDHARFLGGGITSVLRQLKEWFGAGNGVNGNGINGNGTNGHGAHTHA